MCPVASRSDAGRPRRATTVRAALRAAVEEARDAERMTAEHEVTALLADRYAAAVDRASRVKEPDTRVLLQAGEKLAELMRRLPIRQAQPAGGGEPGGADGGRGRLLDTMDGEPEVGDAADS